MLQAFVLRILRTMELLERQRLIAIFILRTWFGLLLGWIDLVVGC
jgi:hypothetical protein